MSMQGALRLPVVSAGAEYLVMGYLMRRNVLAYKAPPGNEGYDLICIHPDPRHRPAKRTRTQVRIQVKSRFASDASRGFPLGDKSLDAFDFLVAVFMNIGKFNGKHSGLDGAHSVEFYTLPAKLIRQLHTPHESWSKVRLYALGSQLQQYRDEAGFEFVAEALGVERPRRERLSQQLHDSE